MKKETQSHRNADGSLSYSIDFLITKEGRKYHGYYENYFYDGDTLKKLFFKLNTAVGFGLVYDTGPLL